MFSLKTLFIVVAIAALGIAGLFSESDWFASSFVGITVVLFLWGIVEARKVFWRAFYICGIGYLVITTVQLFARIKEALPTTRLFDAVYSREVDAGVFGIDIEHFEERQLAGHCAVALCFGLCAGLLCEWRSQTEEQKKGGT